MRSLFLKIFLSFWLAQALFLVLATLVTLAIRQQAESAWEAEQAQILSQAVQTYETGGQAALAQYLDQVRQSQGVRAYLLDENDQELSGRRSRDWAKDGEHRRPRSSRGGFLGWMAARPQRQSITSASGHRYTLVVLPPPHGPFGDPGIHGLGIFIAILSSGLVCYLLARYLTSPVVRLRAATQKLAAGDLTARAGVPPPGRHDEIAELVRDFDTMADRLETLVKAQSRLLNDISHELRSPLARLNVALGLARQRSGAESTAMLERIELEANRLNELIGRILTLARLEDGEQRVPQTPVPLDELVLNVAEDAEFEAQARHCHVRNVIPAGDWGVRGNASLLHSAIENVARNAIRYTQEGTTVEIQLERNDTLNRAEAVLRVSDCGPGVPSDALMKLFEPFYRL